MEEVKIRELPEKGNIHETDYLPIEDDDGTKKVLIKHFRSLVLSSLYFNNIDELKNNSSNIGLKDGDICQTLGYYEPGDGGGALYEIKYDPSSVEDNMNVHYLSYSDTLRAKLIPDDKINVHQFGAKGDGKTDDTKAIQAALNNSWEKTIEFTHGKKYLIKSQLNITNSNTIINAHGAILYPQYVTGLNIGPEDGEDAIVHDIYINNLNIDGSRSSNSVYIYKSSNVHLYKSVITGSSSKGGVVIKNSDFINIENCEFESNGGSSIILEGDNNDCARSVIIEDCKFTNFLKAVHVLSTGITVVKDNVSIIIQRCTFNSETNNSVAVYIACPVNYVNINDNIVTKVNKFLYYGGSSTGDVYCNGITCDTVSTLFDFEASNGTLHLDGSIRVISATILFNNLQGKLHSNILWDAVNGTQLNNNNYHYGEMFDVVNPTQYNIGGYGIEETSLNLRCCHNVNVDWNSSVNNLESINGGFKGQLVHVKSSTGKSIISKTKKIILSSDQISLGAYGVQLQFDGLQWVQVEKAPAGPRGIQGAVGSKGEPGKNGVDGKSAYQSWLDAGNAGTEAEFLASLKGEKGDAAISISELVNMLYPVGTIYFTVNNINPGTRFGGTWVQWGAGKVPVGVDTSDASFNTVEKTGGEKSHTLTVAEIPSHTHSVGAHAHGLNSHTHSIPEQTVSGITTSYNDIGHTHIIPPLSGTTNLSGEHSHTVNTKYSGQTNPNGSASRIIGSGTLTKNNSDAITIVKNGEHTHTFTTNISTSDSQSINHRHTVSVTTPATTSGAASGSTANSTAFNTSAVGSGSAHNNLQPYITCYMWKRTA